MSDALGDFSTLPEWATQKARITDEITSRRSDLKIILKIKDDPFFLTRWIEHHEEIAGMEGLIIFDNMSSSGEMADLYAKYVRQGISVYRYAGFHNDLHRPNKYPDLYAALAASTERYAFLDADESLIYVDESFGVHGGALVKEKITACRSPAIATCWLENAKGCESRFWYDLAQKHNVAGLRGGKPILSPAAELGEMLNHNMHIDRRNFSKETSGNFVLLHFKRLSARQRIDANMRKLHAYNAFKGPMTLEGLMSLDADDFAPGNKRNWIKEVQTLVASEDASDSPPLKLPKGNVEISDDSRLIFYDDSQRAAFHEVQERPWESLMSALS